MMIRACLQFLACWYLDSDRNVPAWLQRRIDADLSLRQSLGRLHRLERDLQVAARFELERSRVEPAGAMPMAQEGARPEQAIPYRQPVQRVRAWRHRALPYAMAASLAIVASAIWPSSNRPNSSVDLAIRTPSQQTEEAESSPEPTPSRSAIAPARSAPLRAAKRLLERSLQSASEATRIALHEPLKTSEMPGTAFPDWEDAWKQEVVSLKTGVRDGARFFAVRLPAAGLRLLHPNER